jgi:hypothetical protein
VNTNLNKYNVQTPTPTTTPNYGTVSYTQTIDAPDIKQRLPISYATTTTSTVTPTTSHQSHVPEITQDLSVLLQQTDTKRVLQNVNPSSWQTLTSSTNSTVADCNFVFSINFHIFNSFFFVRFVTFASINFAIVPAPFSEILGREHKEGNNANSIDSETHLNSYYL